MYSKETYDIAGMLRHDSEARRQLIAMLNEFSQPIRYSNEDFDQKQQLASFLFQLQS